MFRHIISVLSPDGVVRPICSVEEYEQRREAETRHSIDPVHLSERRKRLRQFGSSFFQLSQHLLPPVERIYAVPQRPGTSTSAEKAGMAGGASTVDRAGELRHGGVHAKRQVAEHIAGRQPPLDHVLILLVVVDQGFQTRGVRRRIRLRLGTLRCRGGTGARSTAT